MTLIPVLQLHAGEHVSDELVAVVPSLAFLRGLEQLVGHGQGGSLGIGALCHSGSQPDGREAALDRASGPQAPPVLGRVVVEGGQRLPARPSLASASGYLEPYSSRKTSRAAWLGVGGGLDDLAEEAPRVAEGAWRAVDHGPRRRGPAALLTRAWEHVPQRGPRAAGAFTDHQPGLVSTCGGRDHETRQPSSRSTRDQPSSTASSSLTPTSREPMMISRPQLRVLPNPDVDADPVHIQV